MEKEYLIRPFISVVISSIIAIRAFRRKSLDLSGAFLGFLVMFIHMAVGYRFGALLLLFFFTSSRLTKVGKEKKRSIEADFKQGGQRKRRSIDADFKQGRQRNWLQVLANSGIATILVVSLGILTEWHDKCLDSRESALVTCLIGAVVGHYACCNGDTWSSELGMLSDAQPQFITTFKHVRKGTNGAVTTTGLVAAAAAGGVIGVTFVLFGLFTAKCASDLALKQLLVIPISTTAGLCGRLIESLLGATVKFSGFCTVRNKVVDKPGPTVRRISGTSILDNNAVNLVSVLLTTLLTSIACLYLF